MDTGVQSIRKNPSGAAGSTGAGDRVGARRRLPFVPVLCSQVSPPFLFHILKYSVILLFNKRFLLIKAKDHWLRTGSGKTSLKGPGGHLATGWKS